MGNYNYLISYITEKGIQREKFTNKNDAIRKYDIIYDKMRYVYGVVIGMQLWQHAKGKTIDNDPRARIIKQYYM